MKADTITLQFQTGLISMREAAADLRTLAAQSAFNANYSDSPGSYWRWTQEAQAARLALASL